MAALVSMDYNNPRGLNDLKLQSKADPKAAIGEVAQQFEALFVSMMMKSMRDTLPQDGMFDSSAMSTYQEMFDKQLSLDLSRRNGFGLAAVIERQLSAAQLYSETASQEPARSDDPAVE